MCKLRKFRLKTLFYFQKIKNFEITCKKNWYYMWKKQMSCYNHVEYICLSVIFDVIRCNNYVFFFPVDNSARSPPVLSHTWLQKRHLLEIHVVEIARAHVQQIGMRARLTKPGAQQRLLGERRVAQLLTRKIVLWPDQFEARGLGELGPREQLGAVDGEARGGRGGAGVRVLQLVAEGGGEGGDRVQRVCVRVLAEGQWLGEDVYLARGMSWFRRVLRSV